MQEEQFAALELVLEACREEVEVEGGGAAEGQGVGGVGRWKWELVGVVV
jgi:hypothetical protein